ncbi:hypothetical protein BDD12DRAFT_949361 [Trichophaea hybrida]|nr:hypothetical protein BDD12DRAFT_949361 [Trichophaea hybrida]
MSNNSTRYPSWIPGDFIVSSGNNKCPTPKRVLISFAIYNSISIAMFAIIGSTRVRAVLSGGRLRSRKPWTFWSAAGSVVLQFASIISTAFLIRASGYRVDLWQLIQLWAVRPRATWIIGNLFVISHQMGFMNGALDNAVVEVFVSIFGCVFIGRLVRKTVTTSAADVAQYEVALSQYYWMMTIGGVLMLVSTAFEMLWAVWAIWRALQTKGKAEAQDINIGWCGLRS